MDRPVPSGPTRAFISVDVERRGEVVFNGHVEGYGYDCPEYTSDSLSEIVDWAFTMTSDVLVRLDGRGWWRVRSEPATLDGADTELLGELFLEGGPGRR
jgi:hypothetical protein